MNERFDLELFHSGDEALFARLIRSHSPRLLPALRRYAQDAQEAQDLLQETWLRAFRKRRTFSGSGSLLGWLFTVARTVGLAAVARRGPARRADIDPMELCRDGREPGPDAERIHAYGELHAAIMRLPERQRCVILLRIVEGRSTRESAALLECAEGTIKATLHQAIDNLRQLLGEKTR